MAKIGRNQPCPCGSGKKYKKCHGNPLCGRNDNTDFALPSNEVLQQKIRRMEAQQAQRKKQQGLGKGILSEELQGQRIVCVGSKVHYSDNWRTFHDFLQSYLIKTLGIGWFKGEHAKPGAERHQIVRWYDQFLADAKRLGETIDGVTSAPMTGAARAFLNLAYNIYLIAHHAKPLEADTLVARFVERLKSGRTDDFIGKLFETYASAAFLKAGFLLAYENETDGSTSHVEFNATYPATGKIFSVEVKSRNRVLSEDGPIDDVKRLRIASKLNKALAKKANHTRVVFIEVNVPDVLTEKTLDGWPRAALEQIRYAEQTDAPDGAPKPSAYVIVTNHAFHNNLDAIDVGIMALAVGCRIPDFGPDVKFSRLKEVLERNKRHAEILGLMDSIKVHSEIPTTFDGEIPVFAFGRASEIPRLRIGKRYMIPDANGQEVPGLLEEAVVMENDRMVFGIYRTDENLRYIATSPMTENEFIAWKMYPETFFGKIQEVVQPLGNWMDLAMFFYKTYKDSSRKKLLEFMAGHENFGELQKLPQEELAILYSERMGWSGWSRNHSKE